MATAKATKKAEDDKPKLSLDELAAQYGYAAAFFNSNPELAQLIKDAVANQWTPDKFRAALMNSNWYRSLTESNRAWIELSARDPAEAQKRINDKARQIQQMANQQGISITADRLKKMATDALSMGWDDTLLQQSVAAEWTYSQNGTSGTAATLETRINQLAADYGLTVTSAQMADFIGGTLAGRYTEDHLADWMRDTARSKYPSLQGYLDMGMTVKQVASPYINSYAQILEAGPDTISVNDPLIQRALQGGAPTAQQKAPGGSRGGRGDIGKAQMIGGVTPVGQPPAATQAPPPVVPQSLYDFERSLRRDPRWLSTKNAKESMTTSAIGVLKDFGIYG